MYTKSAILGLLALTGNTFAAPVADVTLVQRETFKGTAFKGDGSAKAGWPTDSKWVTFDKMWSTNKPKIGCPAGTTKNSAAETDNIKAGIQSVAKSSGVDQRFILAVIMQESHGCLRVGATASPGAGVNNPGIMQSHNGQHNCPASGACGKDIITGMIADGTTGTKDGSGLKQLQEKAATVTGSKEKAQLAYWAARYYNSGENSIKKGSPLEIDTNDQPGATPSYSSDIANRLIGFSD
ncbi:hypothetical protein HYALB_00011613 [Hymenoscyphus albidus]|uniref:Uncharacterized protein n=1 Tax=Hymenoscyphus albidus TaxID=595503 RepID=A0A9N9LM95_9HELO|nr:hypothetical protein HYALB_00011613 [Hymenoscyphus albidus]